MEGKARLANAFDNDAVIVSYEPKSKIPGIYAT